jgi:polysaccharide biosynthesis protein PslG
VRRLLPLLTMITAVALLGGCSSGSESSEPSSSAAASASAAPTATASASPSASASATPSSTASAVGEERRIPATVTGLHVAGVQDGAWPDANVPFGGLRLWDNGTAWSQIETVKGRYNWALLDRSVANAEKHGMKNILLVLGSTPTWNAKEIVPGDYPVPGAASPPKSLAAWDAFVKAVVSRYKGRINAYQVWNEASLAMFWSGSPEKMAELTKRAYDIIKAEDPKATVVAASTTVRLEGAFNRFFPRYLAALKDLGWPVDVLAAHMYPASKGTTDERAAFITQVTGAITAAGAPDLPVWDTELNYGLAGPGPSNPLQTIEGARARDWVVQTTFDSLARGISRTYWYIWTPKPYPLLGLQLTNDSGAVKGMRVVDQWIVGGTTTGCTDDGSVTSCPVVKNGVPSVIVWANDRTGTFTAPASLTQACTTANACTAISGPLEVGETPVRLLP